MESQLLFLFNPARSSYTQGEWISRAADPAQTARRIAFPVKSQRRGVVQPAGGVVAARQVLLQR